MKVIKQENESVDRFLTRFKRAIVASGILKEYADNQSFISKSERNRSKRKLSKRRKQRLTLENE
jgi:ribosomal protein S21